MKITLYIFLTLFFLKSDSFIEYKTKSLVTRKKIALLVSVENTELIEHYDNTATQDGDMYRDNIEEVLEDKDFDDIFKMSSPSGNKFLEILENLIKSLNNEDLFIFYFYGHGGQVSDISGDEKSDYKDETLVLKDREVIDDEIYEVLNSSKANAKIIIIVEACNSGSSIKFYEKSTPFRHKSLNEELEKPNLDILYIGATTDGDVIPSNAFNEVFLEVIKDNDADNYYEFTKSLSTLMLEYYDVFPTIDISWASKPFLESQPFK